MLSTAGLRTLTAVLLAGFSGAFAQNVISAKSGLIHYIEGQVFIGDKPVEMKYSIFPNLKDADVLRTAEGRAEVLLTPGMFLRLAENSSVRMVSTKLTDTRIEVLTGSTLLETAELMPEYPITLLYKDQTITFKKTGLIRLDADSGVLKVYTGEASVLRGGELTTIKAAREAQLNGAMIVASKFDAKESDEFYRWAARRASYLAVANVAAAKSAYDGGTRRMAFSQWSWNPWYGMFTYLPYRGYYMSPFGYGFWSPATVVAIAYPNYNYVGGNSGYNATGANGFSPRYDSGLGYNVAQRGANMTTSAPAVSAPAASAPVSSRGSDSSAGAGGSGRGR